jgi:hypothetical protein
LGGDGIEKEHEICYFIINLGCLTIRKARYMMKMMMLIKRGVANEAKRSYASYLGGWVCIDGSTSSWLQWGIAFPH